jgi:hypothetical protein
MPAVHAPAFGLEGSRFSGASVPPARLELALLDPRTRRKIWLVAATMGLIVPSRGSSVRHARRACTMPEYSGCTGPAGHKPYREPMGHRRGWRER